MVTDTIIKIGYKQTDLGVIPESWDVKKLGELGTCLIGLTYKPRNVKNDGFLVLRSSNVQSGRLSFLDNVYVDVDVPEKIKIRKGDILICARNGSRDLIGKSALISKSFANMTFGAFMSVFRTEKNSDYIFYQFQSNLVKRQINEHLGATINQITNKSLSSFNVVLPLNDSEQIAIASVLSDTDALIEHLETLIAKKRSIKEGTMQQLLTGNKRLPGFSEKWEVKKLGDFLDYEQPTEYLVTHTDYNDNNQTPVLTAGKTFILGYTNEEHGIFKKLPVIIFDDFTTAIKFVDFPFKAKSSAMKMLIPINDNVNMRFIYEIMLRIKYPLGDHKRHWIGEYRYLEITVPSSPQEQTAIATVLSDMNAEIENLKEERDKLYMLKQGMMQQLLTGRIRIHAYK